ncbi:hypothetical protein H1P_2810011 [Hyella patelloides LEGE 07179]|uniref:Uncharacterized protein n=1 Tax=Hyella patelloides LEGE 07179 TaxID=945734 RepID=A0A563VTF0_9CYAN|nr:hypothetical protein H1P_2810011 [Hyella patelloides LEGE 07179]
MKKTILMTYLILQIMLLFYMHGERSQVVKAVVCGTTIRGFEPRRSPLILT